MLEQLTYTTQKKPQKILNRKIVAAITEIEQHKTAQMDQQLPTCRNL